MALTVDDKKLIDKLMADGLTCREIKSKIGTVSYTAVWTYANRDIVNKKKRQKSADNPKYSTKSLPTKYVETGRQMPPTNPPRPMTIIVDKDLVEFECKRLGLQPPVTTLANRPATFHQNGMEWDGKKWSVSTDTWNSGTKIQTGPLLRSNI